MNVGLWCSPTATTSSPTSSAFLAIAIVALMRSCSVGVRPVVGSGVTSPTVKMPSCMSLVPGSLVVADSTPNPSTSFRFQLPLQRDIIAQDSRVPTSRYAAEGRSAVNWSQGDGGEHLHSGRAGADLLRPPGHELWARCPRSPGPRPCRRWPRSRFNHPHPHSRACGGPTMGVNWCHRKVFGGTPSADRGSGHARPDQVFALTPRP